MKVVEEKQSGGDKVKRKPIKTLFQTDKKETQSKNADQQQLHGFTPKENVQSGGKLQWGFDGFKKLNEMSQTPKEKGPTTNTKQIKGKLNPFDEQSDSFVDNKVLGQNIKKELAAHIQADTNNEWTTFDDDEENCRPKTFSTYGNPFAAMRAAASKDFQPASFHISAEDIQRREKIGEKPLDLEV